MISDQKGASDEAAAQPPTGEQGYMLLGLMVAVALILLALSVAASKTALSLRREREAETVRRADQYVRAIRRFYLKNRRYPGTVEQLVNTNNVRYLRQRYVDPLTGKEFRMIGFGHNKTTVKGFFGEPLEGLPAAGLGAAAGMQSPGIGGAGGVAGPGSAFGAGATAGTPGGVGTGATAAAGAATGTDSSAAAGGAAGASGGAAASGAGQAGSSGATGAFGSPGGVGSQSATTFGGSTGAIIGVGSEATGDALIEWNQQKTYQDWEFLYDPRIESLRQKAALNSGVGSAGAGSIGQAPGAFGAGNTPAGTSGAGTNPTNTTGGAQPPKP